MTTPLYVPTWTVDGLLLTDSRNMRVETRDLRTAGLRGSDTAVYGRHGVLPGSRRRLDASSFGLTLWWHGLTEDACEQAFDSVLRAAAPVHRTATWVRSMGDGTTRTCQGRVATSTSPVFLGWDEGQLWRAQLDVTVPGARWTDSADTSDATPAGGALPTALVLVSKARSTLECDDLRYLIAGPITDPTVTVTSDLVPGQSFTWVGTVPAGSTLTVDSGAYAVTGTGSGFTPSIETLRWSGERILAVPPAPPGVAAPGVQLSGTSGGSATQLTVVGRASYLT